MICSTVRPLSGCRLVEGKPAPTERAAEIGGKLALAERAANVTGRGAPRIGRQSLPARM
jgi:hypothetical protein